MVELKTVDFEPEFVGKLSFYLSAEYALQDINKPIGISEYRVSDKMDPAIMENLPSIEDIENRIKL